MTLELQPSDSGPRSQGPVLFVVMDGVGVGRGDEGDAVATARTPVLDELKTRASYRTLRAHGTAVGLPSDKDMGNSEVGHNAIGAGRIIDQGALLVNNAIEDKSIFATELYTSMRDRCQGSSALHLIGLLSDGNVHSHENHLHAMIRRAHEDGFKTVYVHPLLDGRDVPETSAMVYVERLEAVLGEFDGKSGCRYRVASGGGRMTTTMDRYEADWSMVERGYNAHVHGTARPFASLTEAIAAFRTETPGISDQNLPEFTIVEDGQPVGKMKDGDCVIFFNFRGDRAIEICRAFDDGDEFDKFDRGTRPNVLFGGMTSYDGDYDIPKKYLVPPPSIDRTMGEYLASAKVSQFACSETQKYGHVTYFWNGNRSGRFDEALEDYVEVPSDRVSFDERPWMKAAEITDATIDALRSQKYRFLRINYANGDMVGHTGDLRATRIAVETVDLCLERLLKAAAEVGATVLITADHGNADDMFERNKDGTPKVGENGQNKARTSHTLAPVPLYVLPKVELRTDLSEAGLANLAATVLELLGYQAPEGYEPSLLQS